MSDVNKVVLAYSGGLDTSVAVRWMIEELRVSLFAQHLGTPTAVSEQRIHKALADAAHP